MLEDATIQSMFVNRVSGKSWRTFDRVGCSHRGVRPKIHAAAQAWPGQLLLHICRTFRMAGEEVTARDRSQIGFRFRRCSRGQLQLIMLD